MRLNLNLKALWQLRELTIFTVDALEHEDCAIQIWRSRCLNPYITNWYLKILKNRAQRECFNNFECDWKQVNKWTSQGSVSGRYLFNIFTLGNHDALFKFADDATITAPVWKEVDYSDQLVPQFLDWTTNTNGMSCNPSKCRELTIKKRDNCDLFSPTGMISSCKEVDILWVTLQCDSKFSVRVKKKLIKAKKSLYILRTMRKEGYNLSEIDLLLKVTRPWFFGGVPSYFEALWYPHLYFYRKSNT